MKRDSPPFLLLGTPVVHSLSPAMHTAAFHAIGRDNHYLARETTQETLEIRLDEIRRGEAGGANITVPLKHAAFHCMDEVSESARRCGAVNTVERLADGKLRGHSTDGEGFLKSLSAFPLPKTALFFGGGGAAISVARTLQDAGVTAVWFTVRRRAEVQTALQDRIPGAWVRSFEDPFPVEPGPDTWLIQSTPLGTGTAVEGPDGEAVRRKIASWLPETCAGAVAVDLIYYPEHTPFLHEAEKRGCLPVSGLGMLVYQAMASFQIWTNQCPPETVWWTAARDALAQRQG